MDVRNWVARQLRTAELYKTVWGAIQANLAILCIHSRWPSPGGHNERTKDGRGGAPNAHTFNSNLRIYPCWHVTKNKCKLDTYKQAACVASLRFTYVCIDDSEVLIKCAPPLSSFTLSLCTPALTQSFVLSIYSYTLDDTSTLVSPIST